MYVPPLQKECPVCHHMVAINYVRGKEVQRCFCGARRAAEVAAMLALSHEKRRLWLFFWGTHEATLLALRQYDKRRAELNER